MREAAGFPAGAFPALSAGRRGGRAAAFLYDKSRRRQCKGAFWRCYLGIFAHFAWKHLAAIGGHEL